MARPLGQIVVHVDHPEAVENVAGGPECRRDVGSSAEIEKGRKSEPHSAAFVSDQRPAATAADFARQDPLMPLAFAVEKLQMLDSGGHSDIAFMEDGHPLHRRAVQFLAVQAVAEFGVHRIRAHLVLNGTAMAPRPVLGYEVGIVNTSIIGTEFIFHHQPPSAMSYRYLQFTAQIGKT